MEELEISRGNAHGNLKELVTWGLVRPVRIKGERKEHFEAEKDVWVVVQCIARARKRKELEPVLDGAGPRPRGHPRPEGWGCPRLSRDSSRSSASSRDSETPCWSAWASEASHRRSSRWITRLPEVITRDLSFQELY